MSFVIRRHTLATHRLIPDERGFSVWPPTDHVLYGLPGGGCQTRPIRQVSAAHGPRLGGLPGCDYCDSTAYMPYTGPFPMSGASVYGHPRTTSCTGYPEADAGHPRATPLRVAGGDPYTHCPPPTLRGLRCEATHGPRIITGYPEAGVAAYVATPRRGPTLQNRRTTTELSTPAF